MYLAELSQYEREGTDYQVTVDDHGSDITIMAPHGGKIGFRTTEIAIAVAGDTHNLYLFEGKKQNYNFTTLHITSHRFDEPRCLRLAGKSRHLIAIHGTRGEGKEILLGSLDKNLKRLITSELQEVGYTVLEEAHNFPGENEMNICNRGIRGKGGASRVE